MYKALLVVLCLFLMTGIAGCGTPPTPEPTPTSIPGYVGGEEEFAYGSFIEYYKVEIDDCNWDDWIEYDVVAGVNEEYQGTAVYVGDAVWRFHIQTWWFIPDRNEEVEYNYEEEMIEVRSLPDRTWDNVCVRSGLHPGYETES